MLFKSWLQSFGRKQRRNRAIGHTAPAAERMEDRSLLSVAALFVNGELFVSSDGGDSIAIRQNSGTGRVQVLANGAVLGTAPNVATSLGSAHQQVSEDLSSDVRVESVRF